MGLTKVFVGNLSFKTKDSDLASEFSSAGKVVSANIITRGPRSLGYGFVELESEEEAQRAVALMNKKNIDTREINVELARPRDESRLAERRTPPSPLRRGRGRWRGGRGRGGRGYGGPPGGMPPAPGSPGGGLGSAPPPTNGGAPPPVPGSPSVGGAGGGPGSPGLNNNMGAVREVGRGNYPGRRGGRYRPRGDFSGGVGGDYGGGEGGYNPGSPSMRGRGGRGRGRGGRGRGGYQRPYPPRSLESSKTTLYVANLPFSVEDDALMGLFKDLKATKAYVVRAKNNRSKGFGFVDFANEDDQKAALAASENLTLSDRNLIVKVAMTENKLEDAKEVLNSPDANANPTANPTDTINAEAPDSEKNENKLSTS